MRLTFLLDNDVCWHLNTLNKSISLLLKKNFVIDGIWIFPQKLSHLSGFNIKLWYFKTFGFFNFLKLSIFYCFVLLKNLNKKKNKNQGFNFKDLSKKYNFKINYAENPNDRRVSNFIKKNKTDIIIILTNHILKKKIINSPKLGVINKHSSVLPALRGLFPYFWAKIYNLNNGITFHLVNDKIDNAKILFQRELKKKFPSMISFYYYVFNKYPLFLLRSLTNIKKRRSYKFYYKSSYYSLPSKKNYMEFKKKDGNIILIKDIFNISNYF